MHLLQFAIALLVGSALAAPARADGIEIPCSGSPKAAVLDVPEPANRFVHVLCTKYGHVLAPVAGWFWTPPGTYSPVFYPSQMVRENPEETGNAVYFASITATPLEGQAASERWSVLAEVFPHEAPPSKALEIVATSSRGSKHTLYIFPNAWGYSCSPVCSKEAAFVMVSQRKEAPRW